MSTAAAAMARSRARYAGRAQTAGSVQAAGAVRVAGLPRVAELRRPSNAGQALRGACDDGLTVEVLPYSSCPRSLVEWSPEHALVLHPGGSAPSKLNVIKRLLRAGVCGAPTTEVVELFRSDLPSSVSPAAAWRHLENRVGEAMDHWIKG